ncbi:MAG: TRAP transporter small permease subunit [Kiritimatiellae bacterium]|nr:TRAP transporter small permease subunit [Kiritimatiellia bacterium]MDD4342370.1 TRAP transporter small permease subunit [Kiritimatiellia bacterium]
MRPLSGTSARTGILRTLIRAMSVVGSLAVVGLVGVTVADVIGRQFGLPVKGAYDLVRVLGAVAIACALPLTKAVKGHIAIEYFFQKMDRRGRAVVDTLMRLVLLVLFGLLAVQFVRQGLLFRDSGEVTTTLHMPMFWVPWLMALACAVTAGVTLWHVLHPGRSMMSSRR